MDTVDRPGGPDRASAGEATAGEATAGEATVDPFGVEVAERWWRRLAGVGIAVTLVGSVAVAAWTVDVLPLVLFGVAVVYVVGLPVSWFVVRHGGAVVRRHVLAGICVGLVIATIIALPSGWGWWPLLAILATVTGALVGGLAAWSGVGLPSTAVNPVAIGGLVVLLVVLPLATWVTQRPPAPFDFVVVHEPSALRPPVADAEALAAIIVHRIEALADGGASRISQGTWVTVADELGEHELAGVATWIRFTLDEELPSLASSGEPVRLITVIFDGSSARACVVVTESASRAEPSACTELGLV